MTESGPTILVIDDDWMNRELLEAYLKPEGYRVLQAHSGEQGLKLAFEEVPALVMLDVRLSGIDGFEVLRQLKADARTQTVPVLMISGLQSDEDVQAANEEGAAGYVCKPYDAEALLAQIAALVNAA